jgi:hypothetical protein
MGAVKNQRAAWLPIPLNFFINRPFGATRMLWYYRLFEFFTDNWIFSTDFEKFVTNYLILYKAHYQLHSLLSNSVTV